MPPIPHPLLIQSLQTGNLYPEQGLGSPLGSQSKSSPSHIPVLLTNPSPALNQPLASASKKTSIRKKVPGATRARQRHSLAARTHWQDCPAGQSPPQTPAAPPQLEPPASFPPQPIRAVFSS